MSFISALITPPGDGSLDEEDTVVSTPLMRHNVHVRGSSSRPTSTKLSKFQVAAYSVGHVINDMSAAVWFSYLLLYLQDAENLSGTQAGAVMFAGQLADALATPLVGLASDAGRGCLCFGRRKAWNLVGVCIVSLNFFLMFGGVLRGEALVNYTVKAAFLGMFAALFNVGWAAVQVSHMSMVPELTRDEGERVTLNSSRYFFTVLSNCAVFVVMFFLLPNASSEPSPTGTTDARYTDAKVYSNLSLVVLGVGVACSVFFLTFAREPALGDLQAMEQLDASDAAAEAKGEKVGGAESNDNSSGNRSSGDKGFRGDEGSEGGFDAPLLSSLNQEGEGEEPPARKGSGAEGAHYDVAVWRDWLWVGDFWRVMGVYTAVRLSVNISQVYLTFFVTETLAMDQHAVAITPLLLYVSQLAATLASRRVALALGRRRAIFLGSMLTCSACAVMATLQSGHPSTALVYPAVLLLGTGLALSMVISVSMEADLVGNRVFSAAFVYGACSFADKLASGLFVLAIQTLRDVQFGKGTPHHTEFIRWVNSAVPAVAALVAAALAATIVFPAAPARPSTKTPSSLELPSTSSPGMEGYKGLVEREVSLPNIFSGKGGRGKGGER